MTVARPLVVNHGVRCRSGLPSAARARYAGRDFPDILGGASVVSPVMSGRIGISGSAGRPWTRRIMAWRNGWYSVSVLSNFERSANRRADPHRGWPRRASRRVIEEVTGPPRRSDRDPAAARRSPVPRRFMPGYVLVRMEMTERRVYHAIILRSRVSPPGSRPARAARCRCVTTRSTRSSNTASRKARPRRCPPFFKPSGGEIGEKVKGQRRPVRGFRRHGRRGGRGTTSA